MQQQVAPAAGLDRARDVFEDQHEASDAARRVEHRRRLNAQQLPFTCGDELRDRVGAALFDPAPNLVERVDDETLVEDAEHGSAEPDRGAAETRGVTRQQMRGTRVVEQDAALGVAHEHALRELGHQCGEPVLLLLEMRVRLFNARLDVAPQCVVRLGQAIDRAGELAHLGHADKCDAMIRVCRVNEADLFCEAQRGARVGRHPPLKHSAEQEQQQKGERREQDRALGQHRAERIALRRVERGPQRNAGDCEEPNDEAVQQSQPECESGTHRARCLGAGCGFAPAVPWSRTAW